MHGLNPSKMENKRNQISFDFADSPELKSIFDSWEVGKSYTLDITFQLNSKSDANATATIEKVVNDEDENADEPKEVEPDMSHPVMIAMSHMPMKDMKESANATQGAY